MEIAALSLFILAMIRTLHISHIPLPEQSIVTIVTIQFNITYTFPDLPCPIQCEAEFTAATSVEVDIVYS
jgi:hypothetical protein